MSQLTRSICCTVLAVIAWSVQLNSFSQDTNQDQEAALGAAFQEYVTASEAGDLLAASSAAETALSLSRAVNGEDSQDTAALYLNYAAVLNLQGQTEAAENAYLAVIEIDTNLYGAGSLEQVPVYVKLGSILGTTRQITYLGNALSIQQQRAPNDLPAYVDLATEVAQILVDQFNDRTTAYSVLKPVYDLLEQNYGEDAAILAKPMLVLGNIEANQRDPMPQMRRYWKAIDIVEESFPDDPVLAANFSLEAGRALVKSGHYSESREFFEGAYDLFEDELGTEHEQTARAAFGIGDVLKSQNRCKQAEAYLLSALAVFAGNTRNHEDEFQTRIALVNCYNTLKKSELETEQLQALARLVEFNGVREYVPIMKPPPIYPPEAVTSGSQGYVLIQYTVDASGHTRDIEVVDSSGSDAFQQAAIESAVKYRYIPRMIDGEIVSVENVSTRIEFRLD